MTKRTYRDESGKTCTKCGAYKIFADFYRLATASDGRQSWCKACLIAYVGAKAIRTGANANAYRQARRDVRTGPERSAYRYRISAAEAERSHAIEACGCCARPVSREDRTSHIDHDYTTGKVRGVLCPACNVGIGQLGDTLGSVERASDLLSGE